MSASTVDRAGFTWLVSTIGKRGYIADYLRSSSRLPVRVIGTGNEEHTAGFMSCDKALLMPAIADAGYGAAFIDLCEAESIDAILTVSDLDVRTIAPLRERLSELGIACFFPDVAIADAFGDKWLTYQKLSAHGFVTPDSWLTIEDALAAGLDLTENLVVKPRAGSASQGLHFVNSRDTLESAVVSLVDPLIQRRIDGRLVNVEVCSDCAGRPLAATAWERQSSTAGETGLATTIDHDSAIDLVLDVLNVLPVPGPIDVDIVDSDGELFLLEINTRFGGGYPVSHLAGADFPAAMYASINEPQRTPVARTYRRGVTMMKALLPMVYEPKLQSLAGRR